MGGQGEDLLQYSSYPRVLVSLCPRVLSLAPSFVRNSSLIRLRIEVSSREAKMRLTTAFGPSGPQEAPLAK